MKASIVVPSYNASERLYYNLLSINAQEYDRKDFEVIVVDNGSSDETSEMLSNFDANFTLNTIYLDKNMGRAFARNCGAMEAKGDIIIFHDSDMIAEKAFVKKHIESHQCCNTAVCGQSWCRLYSFYYENFKGYLLKNLASLYSEKYINKTDNLYHKSPLISEADVASGKCFEDSFNLTRMFYAEKKILDNYGNKLEGFYFPWSLLVTNNCSIDKELFTKIEGFDNSFIDWGCEDLDLGYRLYKSGCKFIKRNDIRSAHQEHPINFLDRGEANIYYFTRKYDDIDLLLFYYGYLIGADRTMANNILKEIDELNIAEFNNILELYRRLLVVLRDKSVNIKIQENNWFDEIRDLKFYILLHKKELQNTLISIENEGNSHCFLSSFNSLIKKVFNNSFVHLQ
jgi:glycosyltransferase involved in cell wall biosynthesis